MDQISDPYEDGLRLRSRYYRRCNKKVDARPEIMHPLVGTKKELVSLRKMTEETIAQALRERSRGLRRGGAPRSACICRARVELEAAGIDVACAATRSTRSIESRLRCTVAP